MIASGLLRVFAILLLVAANAFFAAAEFALVSIRETRIQQLIDAHRIGARIVQRLHRNLDEVVNGVQLGVTICSLALGWVGEPFLAQFMLNFLRGVPHAPVIAHGLAIAIAFVIITFFHVILGELVPKSLALQRAEQVALAVAAPMDVFLTITRPAIYVMSRSAALVLRTLGSRKLHQGPVHSPDELKLIVSASRQLGQIPAEQEEMIHNALELQDVTAREVMVPRPDIFSLPGDLTLDEGLARVVEEQHSRIPIYDPQSGPEHIIGVLYEKDLMRWTRLRLATDPSRGAISSRIANMKINQIMRDVLVVPETKVLSELLEEFKERRRHMAIVVDEFGSTAGVITVEDILQQLVGFMEDEFDIAPLDQPALDDASLSVEGSLNIRDLEAQYEISLPRDAGFETLAGFVLAKLQKIPITGESLDFDGHRFTVSEMDGHRIARVNIEKLVPIVASQANA